MAKERIEIGTLSVDYQTLQGQIKVAEGMVRTLKTNLRDLSNVKIDANGSVVGGFNALNDSVDRSNKTTASGKQMLRDFYREQRIQDRTTREATQAVIGFTVGLSALMMTGKESNTTVMAFNRSLLTGVTAMQGAEFTAASLSIAGRNLSGTLGNVAQFLGKNAGMIGAVIGVGAGLIAFFKSVDEEARKASEGGLADFEKRLSSMTGSDQGKVRQFLLGEIEAKQKEVNAAALAIQKAEARVFGFQGKQTKERKAELTLAEEKGKVVGEELVTLQSYLTTTDSIIKNTSILNKFNEQNNAILLKAGTEIQKIDIKLSELNKKKDQGILVDTDGLKIADKIATLEKQKKELLQTTEEGLLKQVSTLQRQYQLGKMTADEYIRQLNAVKVKLTDSEKQADIDKEILALKKSIAEADIEIQRNAKTVSVNFAKELQLIQLQNEEQLVSMRTRTEAEKLDVTKTFALERIRIEEQAQLAILAIEKESLQDQLLIATSDVEKRKIAAQITLNDQAASNVARSATSKRTGVTKQTAEAKEGLLTGAKSGMLEGDRAAAIRLMRVEQLNDALISEEMRLARTERQLLKEKDAAAAEQLAAERERSIERIAMMKAELAAREQLTAQLIQSGFDSYDASKSISENMATIARAQIRQALSVAVADTLKSVFASVPFPFNLVAAPIAGAAAAALFETVVPKFAKGGKLTNPSYRLAGEAGPEFYMPEKDFYDIAREEIIPRMLDLAKRDLVRSTTVINNSTVTNTNLSLASVQNELVLLRKEFSSVVDAIKNLPAPEVILENPIDFEKALQKTYPTVQREFKKKYPDS
jgi:hypothetical protein